MNLVLNLEHLEGYKRELEEARAAAERLKSKIEFLRLQIKQTRERAKTAKHHAAVEQFAQLMPAGRVDVMPHPGGVALSIELSRLEWQQLRHVPEMMSLEHVGSSPISAALCAPVCHQYRAPGGISFYITERTA